MRGFIGIDIETTGLDPETGHILEIGVVLFSRELEPLESVEVIAPDPEGYRKALARELDPFILNMHEKSGLLGKIDGIRDGTTREEVAPTEIAGLVEVLTRWSEALGGKQPMLGSSVHFDRAWLAHHFPELEALFSHRNIDASSLREYAKVVDPDQYAEVEAGLTREPDHRAVNDAIASAETLKALASRSWVAR